MVPMQCCDECGAAVYGRPEMLHPRGLHSTECRTGGLESAEREAEGKALRLAALWPEFERAAAEGRILLDEIEAEWGPAVAREFRAGEE